MPFLTVKRVHYSLDNNEWGDNHDTPASEQLNSVNRGTQISTKVPIYKNPHCSCATCKRSSSLEFLAKDSVKRNTTTSVPKVFFTV